MVSAFIRCIDQQTEFARFLLRDRHDRTERSCRRMEWRHEKSTTIPQTRADFQMNSGCCCCGDPIAWSHALWHDIVHAAHGEAIRKPQYRACCWWQRGPRGWLQGALRALGAKAAFPGLQSYCSTTESLRVASRLQTVCLWKTHQAGWARAQRSWCLVRPANSRSPADIAQPASPAVKRSQFRVIPASVRWQLD